MIWWEEGVHFLLGSNLTPVTPNTTTITINHNRSHTLPAVVRVYSECDKAKIMNLIMYSCSKKKRSTEDHLIHPPENWNLDLSAATSHNGGKLSKMLAVAMNPSHPVLYEWMVEGEEEPTIFDELSKKTRSIFVYPEKAQRVIEQCCDKEQYCGVNTFLGACK
ncbi:unnamed protein product [Timema podura]|uniref:Uncharacterized protein n=1 Tax=Timema podura TaxID=61482 RepID=A0ABN7P3K9_TIMPD|nr:unnamed protein product [Timema podura]